MSILWRPTVAEIQAALDGSAFGPLSQAELSTGVTFREALKSAGGYYDSVGNDGPNNNTAYALSVQAWAAVASAAWVELDRISRGIYQISTPDNYALAAFGMKGVVPWSPISAFSSATPNDAVVATRSPAVSFFCALSGTSAATEPIWPTVIGETVNDGSTVWIGAAIYNAASGRTPAPFPWDVTLRTFLTLETRAVGARNLIEANAGLVTLVNDALVAAIDVIATQPAPDTTADANSLAAIDSLNTALANANAWLAVAGTK